MRRSTDVTAFDEEEESKNVKREINMASTENEGRKNGYGEWRIVSNCFLYEQNHDSSYRCGIRE